MENHHLFIFPGSSHTTKDSSRTRYSLLQCLAGSCLVIPLGGTSQHSVPSIFPLMTGTSFFLLSSVIPSAAYVLMDTLGREGLVNSELANAQVGTIRLKLLKVGARVVHSVRRIVVHLAGGYPLKELFVRVLSRISGLRHSRLSFGSGSWRQNYGSVYGGGGTLRCPAASAASCSVRVIP